ncbi:MAG TPA: M20 family metallopeptidase [Bacillales bacterium]|nr:M20 family metallopeptidase [Bacillales bacterium]
MNIRKKAEDLAEKLIEWRRHLHSHPELSFEEYETAEFVAKKLRSLQGADIQTGVAKTGVVATFSSGEGPVIALRADMDALPITEEAGHAYASKNAGVMHACGHDAHTAILLGAAHLLAEMFETGECRGTVKLIFQPAEETPDEEGLTGAYRMMEEGVYEDVDVAAALHMCPWKPVGEVQVNDGYSMANVDVFNAEISGTGGHGAYPHLGTDPVWMLGPVLQALHGIVPRKVSPLDPAVISVGSLHAGETSNVIPTAVTMEGTMRSYSPEVRELLASELERAFSVVKQFGGHYKLNVMRGEPALDNNPAVNRLIADTIAGLFPSFKIEHAPFGLGGEDFGHVTKKIPGAMFFLGCALPDGKTRDLHTPFFDIDEACLPVGAAILTETAQRYVQHGQDIGSFEHFNSTGRSDDR